MVPKYHFEYMIVFYHPQVKVNSTVGKPRLVQMEISIPRGLTMGKTLGKGNIFTFSPTINAGKREAIPSTVCLSNLRGCSKIKCTENPGWGCGG